MTPFEIYAIALAGTSIVVAYLSYRSYKRAKKNHQDLINRIFSTGESSD